MAQTEIKNYIARQLSEQAQILRLYAYDQNGKEMLKRDFYSCLENHAQSFLETHAEPRWIIVSGLRGVGKTTVLAQIFFKYQMAFGRRILYVTLDEVVKKLGGNLFGVLDAYEETLSANFSELTEDVILLIDEIHFDPKWQFALKSLYDRSRRVFIIATGSSAVALNTTTDVARRLRIEKMYPLKFTEYVMLTDAMKKKNKAIAAPVSGEELGAILFAGNNVKTMCSKLQKMRDPIVNYWQEISSRALDRYIKFYSFPSVLTLKNDVAIYENLNTIIDRIIEKDLPTVKSFSRDILDKVPLLLFMLAGSDTMSLEKLAQNLKDIEIKTLRTVLHALENAEFLFRIYPFSSSIAKRVRKTSKYLFLASSLRAALLHLVDSHSINTQHRGKLLEDVVGMYIYRYFSSKIGYSLSYDTMEQGADFIIDGANRLAIETGWNKHTHQQAVNTLRNINGKYGLLVTNATKVETRDNVLFIPFEYFFLL